MDSAQHQLTRWTKKHHWNLSSALYIFVRYFGTLCNLIATVLSSDKQTKCKVLFQF
ncbi:hypothetical protein SCLCIDRAFT_277385 [Scleroderma citrinum Foug A]|uniref:Uncharacterized protein n=1 Tax=Scleroderma citrinum Foug A TaxID=1036808 RepID=A0A0C3DHU2_9AGAM|nr:hypothetical protein SCLCIDRAFT_277385 [Scleroderma citrinum Foug A]